MAAMFGGQAIHGGRKFDHVVGEVFELAGDDSRHLAHGRFGSMGGDGSTACSKSTRRASALATPTISAVNIRDLHGLSKVSVDPVPASFIFGDSTFVNDPGPFFTA